MYCPLGNLMCFRFSGHHQISLPGDPNDVNSRGIPRSDVWGREIPYLAFPGGPWSVTYPVMHLMLPTPSPTLPSRNFVCGRWQHVHISTEFRNFDEIIGSASWTSMVNPTRTDWKLSDSHHTLYWTILDHEAFTSMVVEDCCGVEWHAASVWNELPSGHHVLYTRCVQQSGKCGAAVRASLHGARANT